MPTPTGAEALRDSAAFLTSNADTLYVETMTTELDSLTRRLGDVSGISRADRAALTTAIDRVAARADREENAPWNDYYSFLSGFTLGLFALFYFLIFGLIDLFSTSKNELTLAAADRARAALRACPNDPCEDQLAPAARAATSRPSAFAPPTLAALTTPRAA